MSVAIGLAVMMRNRAASRAGTDCPLPWSASVFAATSDPEADTVAWGTSEGEGDTVVWGKSCSDPSCASAVWDQQ